MLAFALVVAALVVFILAAVGTPAGRVNLVGAGLALYMGAELATRYGHW